MGYWFLETSSISFNYDIKRNKGHYALLVFRY